MRKPITRRPSKAKVTKHIELAYQMLAKGAHLWRDPEGEPFARKGRRSEHERNAWIALAAKTVSSSWLANYGQYIPAGHKHDGHIPDDKVTDENVSVAWIVIHALKRIYTDFPAARPALQDFDLFRERSKADGTVSLPEWNVERIVTNAGKVDEEFERSVRLRDERRKRVDDVNDPLAAFDEAGLNEVQKKICTFFAGFLNCVIQQQISTKLKEKGFITERAKSDYTHKTALRAAEKFGPILGFRMKSKVVGMPALGVFSAEWHPLTMDEEETPEEIFALAFRWMDTMAQVPDPGEWIRSRVLDPAEWLSRRIEMRSRWFQITEFLADPSIRFADKMSRLREIRLSGLRHLRLRDLKLLRRDRQDLYLLWRL
jgi:hypothetical protein